MTPMPAEPRFVTATLYVRDSGAFRGNMEGTLGRPRASTRGQSVLGEPFGLRDFRARGFPRLPSCPASELHGKEGVGRFESARGLTANYKPLQKAAFLLPWLTP